MSWKGLDAENNLYRNIVMKYFRIRYVYYFIYYYPADEWIESCENENKEWFERLFKYLPNLKLNQCLASINKGEVKMIRSKQERLHVSHFNFNPGIFRTLFKCLRKR